MSALRLVALVLGLATTGCTYRHLEMDERFVDVSASADCRTLRDAAATRGWYAAAVTGQPGRPLSRFMVVPHPLDETWVLSGRVEHIDLSGRTLLVERPRAWFISISCWSDAEPVELELRTCRVGGRSFGVVDPQAVSSAVWEPSRATACDLVVEAKLSRGRRERREYVITFEPSLRSLLERPLR